MKVPEATLKDALMDCRLSVSLGPTDEEPEPNDLKDPLTKTSTYSVLLSMGV